MVHAGCTSGRTATGSARAARRRLWPSDPPPVRPNPSHVNRYVRADVARAFGTSLRQGIGTQLAEYSGTPPFTPPREIHTLTSVDSIIKFTDCEIAPSPGTKIGAPHYRSRTATFLPPGQAATRIGARGNLVIQSVLSARRFSQRERGSRYNQA